jgi:hypothetical protein
MVYTLGEAAKATGKSKATISKAIKSGKISANKLETGTFAIDPSELHRVYPSVHLIAESEQKETPANTLLIELRSQLDVAKERLEEQQALTADLREDRDRWRQQATGLLEDKRPQSFFKRLLGR